MSKGRGKRRGPLGNLFKYGLLSTLIFLILFVIFYEEIFGCLALIGIFLALRWIYNTKPIGKI